MTPRIGAVAHQLHILEARTPWQRLIGLLGSLPLPLAHALRLSPCRAVHTIGMRHPIDVVFMDTAGKVCGIRPSLIPCRVAVNWRARSVLELRAGEVARLGIAVGDCVAPAATSGPDRSD